MDDAEKIRSLIQLIIEMRKTQRQYFKTREKNDLVKAKRLEASVDFRLEEFEEQPSPAGKE